jgi:hypothetical protein
VSSSVAAPESATVDVATRPAADPLRIARFAIAVAVSAGIDVAYWLHAPRHLSGTIQVVGYPTWANWNYQLPFLAYRLTLYAFPLGVVLVYALLAWLGPLRGPARLPRGVVALRDADVEDDVMAPPAGVLSVAGRLCVPALVVLVAASAHRQRDGARIDTYGLGCAAGYLAVVLACAWGLTWYRVRRWHSQRYLAALSLTNGIGGAVVAIAGLWFVSHHTVVVTSNDGVAHPWPWLPWWLAGAGVLAMLIWAGWRLRQRVPVADVERRLLTVVVGSAFVYLAAAQLPAARGAFEGHDDAQNMVGASLLARGVFPWRDQLFIHGLYPDILTGSVGRAVFGDTRWGIYVGNVGLLYPLSVVILYLFAVWVARRNTWVLLASVVFLLAVPLTAARSGSSSPRWF